MLFSFIFLLVCSVDAERHTLILGSAVTTMAYAMHRIVATHPIRYRAWFKTTPWEYPMPLPLGPMTFAWQDILLLVMLEAVLNVLNPGFPTGLATLFFLVWYVLMLSLALWRRQRTLMAIVNIGTPLVLWFMPGLNGKLAGMVLLAAVSQIALRRWLSCDLRREMDEESARKIIAPIFNLSYSEQNRFVDVEFLICLSVWVFVLFELIQWLARPVYPAQDLQQAAIFTQVFLACVVLFRIFQYAWRYTPPVELRVRLRNGLILPGYDKIFVAPILIANVIAFGPALLQSWGLSIGVAMGLTTLIVFLANRYAGPSLRDWQLTGFHSINLNPMRRRSS
jgi:hypothetical protein